MAEAARALLAILAADVAGYSRLMGDDERATMDMLNRGSPTPGPKPPWSRGHVVAWSRMVGVAEAAAERLAEQGLGLEVIDLRSLWPWDQEMVFASVRKTGRLLVVQEAVRVGGFGAEVAATVAEQLAPDLRAPVRRLGAPRVPIPYSRPLEAACRVSAEDVAAAIEEMTATT